MGMIRMQMQSIMITPMDAYAGMEHRLMPSTSLAVHHTKWLSLTKCAPCWGALIRGVFACHMMWNDMQGLHTRGELRML